MPAWRTIHVFISSTFRDMQAERDVLVKKVFPALRAKLEPYRLRIIEIDLRWGITEQQEQRDEVLDLCLKSIHRSRPYFVGLLGERYGWVPTNISEDVFRSYPWLPRSAPNRKSVTELEILYGALNRDLTSNRALIYLRDPAPLAGVPEFMRGFLTDPGFMQAPQGDLLHALAERLSASGIADAEHLVGMLLAGQSEPASIVPFLSVQDRLAILKERLRREGWVRMDGYPWSLTGLKLRWNLARLVLPQAELLERLQSAAPQGIVTPDVYDVLRQDDRMAEFLQKYALVTMEGLDSLAAQVFHDLWERLSQEPEVQSRVNTVQHRMQEQLEASKKQRRFFAWVKHLMSDRLPDELKLLPPDAANELLELVVGRTPQARPLLQAAKLWHQRTESRGAAESGAVESWSDETDGHRRFAESRLQAYVRRQSLAEADPQIGARRDKERAPADDAEELPELEREIEDYLQDPQGRMLVVQGGPGTGKSALLARAWQYAQDWADAFEGRCVVHFIGATPSSATLRGITTRLAVELHLFTEEELELLAENIEDLAIQVGRKISSLSLDQPVVLIIDALDQLDSAYDAHDLHWLPANLPPHMRLIVSVAQDPDSARGQSLVAPLRLRDVTWMNLDEFPLTNADRRELITRIPSLAAKSLADDEVEYLLNHPATANPLYLKVALEELRGFGSFELLKARIREFEQAQTPKALFAQILDWLSFDFDQRIVRDVLSALALSRHGLSEAELQELAIEVCQPADDAEREHVIGEAAALLRYLQPYLQYRGRLIDFHHRSLREAVGLTFLRDAETVRQMHARLARLFERQGLQAEPRWSDPHARSIAETLYHDLQAGNWQNLLRLMNDDEFVFRKGSSPFHRELSAEYAQAMAEAPLDEAVALAIAFSRCCSQLLPLDEIGRTALFELARRNVDRLQELAPFWQGRGERWRVELLKASVHLIGISQHAAAETVLKVVGASYDGDDHDSSYITYHNNWSVLCGSLGRQAEALAWADEGIRLSREMNDNLNLAILEQTKIAALNNLERHQEAAELVRAIWEREREGAMRRVLPRLILSGFPSLLAIGEQEEAEQLLREGMQVCHEYRDAVYDLVHLTIVWSEHCIRNQKPDEALHSLRYVLSFPSGAYPDELRAPLYNMLLQCLLALGRQAEAQAVLHSAWEHPWSEQGRLQMQNCLQALGISQQPAPVSRTADLFLTEALAQQQNHRPDEAEAYFLAGLAFFPDDQALRTGYRELLQQGNGDWDISIQGLLGAVGYAEMQKLTRGGNLAAGEIRNAAVLLIHHAAGQCDREKDFTTAEAFYRRGVALSERGFGRQHSRTVHALNLLAKHYETADDYDRAETQFRRALELAPDDIVLLGNYAFLLQNFRGDLEAARKHYLHALEIDPADAINHTNYASLCLVREERAEAEQHLREAWRLIAGQVDRYTARILFLRAALAVVQYEEPLFFLGQLRSLFDQGIQPLPSRNLAVREYLRRNLTEAHHILFEAIYAAINETDGLVRLGALPAWQAIPPRPLDEPWP